MKSMVAVAVLLSLAARSYAQENVPREEALKAAFAVSADLKKILDTPIPTDPDVKRPVAVRAEQRGLLILPETKLNGEALAKTTAAVTPLGQLWLLKVVPQCDAQAVPGDRLRLVSITMPQGSVSVALCALGLRKDAGGHLELLVYGKEKEPLLHVPLAAMSAPQDNPIEVSADSGGTVTLKILGKYTASFAVADSAEN
jgi:hypothetical protein